MRNFLLCTPTTLLVTLCYGATHPTYQLIGSAGPLGDLGTSFDSVVYTYFSLNFGPGGVEYLRSIVEKGGLGADMGEKKFGMVAIPTVPIDEGLTATVSRWLEQLAWWAGLRSAVIQPSSVHWILAAIAKEMGEIVVLHPSDASFPYRLHRFVAVLESLKTNGWNLPIEAKGDVGWIGYQARSMVDVTETQFRVELKRFTDWARATQAYPVVVEKSKSFVTVALHLTSKLFQLGLEKHPIVHSVFDFIITGIRNGHQYGDYEIPRKLINAVVTTSPEDLSKKVEFFQSQMHFVIGRMDAIYSTPSPEKSIMRKLWTSTGPSDVLNAAWAFIQQYVLELSNEDLNAFVSRIDKYQRNTLYEPNFWFFMCKLDDQVGKALLRSRYALFAQNCQPYLSAQSAIEAKEKEIANIPNETPVKIIGTSLGDIGSTFDKLVSEYFDANFGDAGLEYLRSVRPRDHAYLSNACGTTTGAKKFGIPDVLKREIEHVVKAFTPEKGLLANIRNKKKSTDDLRYRVHRVIGMVEQIVSDGKEKCFAFVKDKATHELDPVLKALKQSNSALPRLVVSGLRRIGRLVVDERQPYFLSASLSSVKKMMMKALDTTSDIAKACGESVVVAKECTNAMNATCNPNMFCQSYKSLLESGSCRIPTSSACADVLTNVRFWCSTNSGVESVLCDTRNKLIETGGIEIFDYFENEIVEKLKSAYTCWETPNTCLYDVDSLLQGFNAINKWMINYDWYFPISEEFFKPVLKSITKAACGCDSGPLKTALQTLSTKLYFYNQHR